ncbi:MAG: tRNA-dihydrouridine synthase family protein [Acidobacteria bacterium]|nr:tRNA-dihydrouridine synthase family protein [Acidobacteriota bacterium]
MSFVPSLPGSLILAPMTKGSNLPFRQLCIELGARILVSEMVVARRLKQKRRSEFALIRRAPGEPCFGVQLAGNKPDELAWATALVEARGADFVDLNLGCPIDHFTRMGLGAALGRQVTRVRRIVEAMRTAVQVPVTVKIRLGWNADSLNYLELAKGIVDGGASALTVHGRTREARYRQPADWNAIAEVAAAVPIPVIGNGDLLFPHEFEEHLRTSGCTALMSARGALIKPWLFRELSTGYWDITAEERVGLYRRYVELATQHWGRRPESSMSQDPADATTAVAAEPVRGPRVLDEHGRERVRDFLRWHVGFWVRYAPQRPDGTWPTMQQRESAFVPRSPLEALLARHDDAAVDYITDQLIDGGDLSAPPAPGETESEPAMTTAG